MTWVLIGTGWSAVAVVVSLGVSAGIRLADHLEGHR